MGDKAMVKDKKNDNSMEEAAKQDTNKSMGGPAQMQDRDAMINQPNNKKQDSRIWTKNK